MTSVTTDRLFPGRTLLLALLALVLAAFPAQAQFVDLSDWVQEGPSENGEWELSGDALSVTHVANNLPTFFVGPDDRVNVAFRGNITVNTAEDNDFIGFVFGYQQPVGDSESYEFILFDWKQSGQASEIFFGEEGFALTNYDVTLPNTRRFDYSEYFWQKDDGLDGVDVYATDFQTTNGWEDFTTYEFEILYTVNRITITITGGDLSGDVIFDVTAGDVGAGSFPAGRLGFYNYSQIDVEYSEIVVEDIPSGVITLDFEPNGPTTIPASGGTWMGTGTLENDTDEDYSAEGWLVFTYPNGRTRICGPEPVFAAAGETVTQDLMGRANPLAIPGDYTLTLNVGTFPDDVEYSDSFVVTKEDGASPRQSSATGPDWTLEFVNRKASVALSSALPEVTSVTAAYPNPFTSAATLSYDVAETSHVRLAVYDLLGREVAVLADGQHEAGTYSQVFEASALSSGVYVYRLTAGSVQETGRMTLQR